MNQESARKIEERRGKAAEPEPRRYDYALSVVYPAFNEEENVEGTVQKALEALPSLVREFEIIVVDDGSADKTGEIIDRLAAEKENVRAVHHEKNRGYGAALQSGFASAANDLVFFSDSDGQFDIREITRLLEHIERYDMVLGYRKNRRDPFHRKLNAWAWNVLVRLLLGVKVKDIDCAFKVYKKKVLDSIEITSNGAMVNTEILGRARQKNFTLKELPVTHYPRLKGEQTGANLKVILKAFRELFRLYGELR